jgi:hypothetical protein
MTMTETIGNTGTLARPSGTMDSRNSGSSVTHSPPIPGADTQDQAKAGQEWPAQVNLALAPSKAAPVTAASGHAKQHEAATNQ